MKPHDRLQPGMAPWVNRAYNRSARLEHLRRRATYLWIEAPGTPPRLRIYIRIQASRSTR